MKKTHSKLKKFASNPPKAKTGKKRSKKRGTTPPANLPKPAGERELDPEQMTHEQAALMRRLTSLPGIGKKVILRLLGTFPDLASLYETSGKDIAAAVKGMSLTKAMAIRADIEKLAKELQDGDDEEEEEDDFEDDDEEEEEEGDDDEEFAFDDDDEEEEEDDEEEFSFDDEDEDEEEQTNGEDDEDEDFEDEEGRQQITITVTIDAPDGTVVRIASS